ncbi:MAG: ABC transporter ATP-binding protein [Gemmatimonadetes bacterium]|jgi:ATP-binding cassette subfamily B protein|nr:ABC transporter ATP-binding protein [Gemmatimonadota bacterium]MBT5448912.1 ABC transporter ATP-binding protein [Gemmatimonadota bacterium]MBT6623379.1 ABC transporter ATP-binding protein [Gemmatimonadota bacterium]MBT6904934.1 ABC transporter ATP-binding protein [Gemmatimonadota bacterium]MBT7420296.1 ABC transporter ATP-binding protein [Gemmatimonadota bacterium]
MEEEELGSKNFDLKLTARLLGYLRPYGAWVGLTFALIFMASVIQQAGPYLTKVAVDGYILPGNAEGLGEVILLFIGLLVLQFALGYAQSWMTSMVGQWAMRDVRVALFSHLQRLPLGFFDRTPVGRLMARNTNDVDALNELFTNGVVSMLSELCTVLAILAYIFYMDVELGAITAAALPLAFAATLWLQSKTIESFREARVRFGEFSASLQETISGMEVVQLFGCEERRAGLFEESNEAYLGLRMHSTWYHCIYFPFMEFGGAMLTALVLWYGGGQVLRDEIQWGVLVAMLQYVPRFFWPIRNIAERFGTFQVAMASSERIFELLDTEPEPKGGGFSAERVRGEIEFREVFFAYEDENWVLQDVSFQAAPGQAIALVGATGAGKSTIINLIGRFYEIQRGAILVDGVDIREWDLEALRRRIGVVQQDVFLFAGDIERNISLGQPQITHEQVTRAAQGVNADGFITALSDGYAHAVAERGASFSSGQRQLLAFARALAAEPDILVLDEATANIDTETEMLIQEALVKLMRDRTSIVVAHRLSTIRKADKILVLHHGRVREQGRHEELLEMGGIYYRLHQLQYKGNDKVD